MRIKPNFDVKKWCTYNEEKYELEIKENAPKDIKDKFEIWKNDYHYLDK